MLWMGLWYRRPYSANEARPDNDEQRDANGIGLLARSTEEEKAKAEIAALASRMGREP